MDAESRRVIAYIAGKLKHSESCAGIFDYAERKQFSFSGTIQPGHISIYDFYRKCQVDGRRTPLVGNLDEFTIIDFGNGRQITVSFDGQTFKGRDLRTKKEFSGRISGESIAIHDEEGDKDFFYSV